MLLSVGQRHKSLVLAAVCSLGCIPACTDLSAGGCCLLGCFGNPSLDVAPVPHDVSAGGGAEPGHDAAFWDVACAGCFHAALLKCCHPSCHRFLPEVTGDTRCKAAGDREGDTEAQGHGGEGTAPGAAVTRQLP